MIHINNRRKNTSDNDKRTEGELTLSEYSGEYVYPNSGTFSITKSTGAVSVESSTITVYVRVSKVGYQTKTITCTAQVEDNTFTGTSAIGYYADVDGNGTVDGVIFSDASSSNKKSYCVSQTNYSGDFGTKNVLKANGTFLLYKIWHRKF